MRFRRTILAAALLSPLALGAQVIDLTVNNTGVAIGDKPRMTGLRFNYRDRRLEEINGVNVTLWTPYERSHGTVNGIALGLPATGARDINGIGVGIVGLGAEHSLKGIAVGGIGVGSGGDMRGIMIGGIGAGGGGDLTGLSIGGIGVGGGRDVSGIQIGGIGVGGGGNIKGLSIGGIGVGGGGNVTGISIGGIGVGAGGDVTGLTVGGVGVGAGGRLKGVAIGIVGVGAPRVEGLVIGGFGTGGHDIHAISLSGIYFKTDDGGTFRGGSLATINNVRGYQHGLTLGVFNYAHTLNGVQIGLINVSDNGGHRRVLPIISVR
jgi:hypothetical protein